METGTRHIPGRRTPYVPSTAITVREILSIALRERWKVAAVVLLAPAIALGAAWALPKTYRAQSDILVKSGREYLAQSDGSRSSAAPTTSKQEDITSEITILGSRAVVQATIDAIGLARLFPDIAAAPPSGMSAMDAAVDAFGRAVSIDPVKLSNIISVAYDADTTEAARLVVNRLIAAYIAKHAEVFAASRTESYADATDKLRAELARTQQALSRIKLDNGIFDMAAQRTALIAQRVEADTRLQNAIDRRAVLEQGLAYLAAQRSKIPGTIQSTNTDKNDETVHARDGLNDLRRTEASLAARYGEANPDLQRVRAQIARLSGAAAAMGPSRTNVANLPSPLAQAMDQRIVADTAELTPLGGQIERYRALSAALEAELRRLERADLDLRTTSARIDVLTDSYKAAQARYEQARTQEQTELAHEVSVVQISPAIASDRAVRPRRQIYAAAGLLAGLLLAGALVVVRILTNNTLATEEAAERMLGLPVLASLPLRRRPDEVGARTLMEVD